MKKFEESGLLYLLIAIIGIAGCNLTGGLKSESSIIWSWTGGFFAVIFFIKYFRFIQSKELKGGNTKELGEDEDEEYHETQTSHPYISPSSGTSSPSRKEQGSSIPVDVSVIQEIELFGSRVMSLHGRADRAIKGGTVSSSTKAVLNEILVLLEQQKSKLEILEEDLKEQGEQGCQ